jgi:MFS family permease
MRDEEASHPELVLAVPVFATRLVYVATLTLLPPLLVQRGVPPALLGVLVGVYGYAAVAMGLLAGALADRFRPARLAALGSSLVAVAIALLLATPIPALMGAARLLHGVAMGLFRPTVSALVLQRVPAERRVSAIAINNVSYVAGTAAGPLVAGVVADRFGLAAGLALGIVVALAAALYLLVLGRSSTPMGKPAPVWTSLRGLPRLVVERGLGAPLVFVMTDMTILHLWLVFLPIYLVQVQGFTLTEAGSLISVEALGYAVAHPIWGRLMDRRGAWVPVLISLLAHGVCVSMIPLAGADWLALASLLVVCGVLNAAAYPGCVALAANRVADSERGRTTGLVSSSSDVGQILGPMLGSLVYAASGRLDAVFGLGLAAAVVGIGGGWSLNRRQAASQSVEGANPRM